MNYYDVLGVPQSASQDEIRSAYRAQIKFFHPDVFRESEAVAKIKTQQLNQAYAILGDPEARAQYDYALNDEKRRQQAQREAAEKAAAEKVAAEKAAAEREAARSQYQRVHYTPKPKAPARPTNRFQAFCLLVAVVSIIGLIVVHSTPAATPAQTNPPANNETDSELTYSEWKAAQSDTVQAEPEPFFNGKIIKYPFGERLCPLKVDVRGNSAHYIYLERLNIGGSDMAFMVDAGCSAEVTVPLGEYNIYYATGDTWYGPDLKFGPDTVYNKCDGTFLFYDDGEYYRGYTLELYLQNNGNLDTDIIDASAFPG